MKQVRKSLVQNAPRREIFVSEAEPAVHFCYSCRRTGVCRLGVSEEKLIAPGISLTKLVCPAEYEGGPGVAHGGWTTEAMDECLGHLNLLCHQMAVTGGLTVEFLRPVPILRPLELRAWTEKVENGRRWNRGELYLASTGALLARAHGVFVERTPAHFERFERWMADEDAKDVPERSSGEDKK